MPWWEHAKATWPSTVKISNFLKANSLLSHDGDSSEKQGTPCDQSHKELGLSGTALVPGSTGKPTHSTRRQETLLLAHQSPLLHVWQFEKCCLTILLLFLSRVWELQYRIHATKGFLQIGSVDTTVNWINTPLEIQGPDVLFWLWGFEFITHLPPLLLYKNPFNSCQSNFYCKNRTENFVTDSMENYILIWTIHFPIPAALNSPLDNESDILLLAYFISKPFNTEIIFLARDGS